MQKKSSNVLDQLQAQNDLQLSNEQESAQTESAKEQTAEPVKEQKSSIYPQVFDKFDNYEPSDDEKDLYHVGMAKVHYDNLTGKYDGQIPYVQKMNEREYNNFKAHASQLGYTCKLLYSPKNA